MILNFYKALNKVFIACIKNHWHYITLSNNVEYVRKIKWNVLHIPTITLKNWMCQIASIHNQMKKKKRCTKILYLNINIYIVIKNMSVVIKSFVSMYVGVWFCCTLVILLFPCCPLMIGMFPPGLVWYPDHCFSFNRFKTFEYRYPTFVLIYQPRN